MYPKNEKKDSLIGECEKYDLKWPLLHYSSVLIKFLSS